MSQGVIVSKKPAYSVKASFLDTVVSQPRHWGFCTITDAGKMIVSNPEDQFTAKDIKAVLETVEKYPLLMHISTGDKPSGQPFILISDANDMPLAVAFLEGDYPAYKDDKNLGEEEAFVQGYLLAKVLGIFTLCEEIDKENFMELAKSEITGTTFEKDILAQMGDRAVMSILFHDKTVHTISKGNENSMEFEWGAASNITGYKEYPVSGTPEPAAEEDPAIAAMRARILAQKAGKPAEGVHKTDAKAAPLNKESALKEDIKNADALGQNGKTEVHYEIRDGKIFPDSLICASRNGLKGWLNNHFGTCPENYTDWVGHPEKCPGIPTSMLKQSSKMYTPIMAAMQEARGKTGTDGKDVSTKNIPTDVANGNGNGKGDPEFPIIGRGAKEDIGKFIKTVDIKSGDILDPTKMQSIETNKPLYWDQFPDTARSKSFDFDRWTPAAIEHHCITWPKATSSLVQTLRYENIMLRIQNEQMKKSRGDQPAPTKTPEEVAREAMKARIMANKKAL